YHSTHDVLPPGHLGPIPNERGYGNDADQIQQIGLLVYLLPHVEQGDLFRQLSVQLDPNRLRPAWYTNPTNWKLAQTRIRVFECPADNIATDTSVNGTAKSLHIFNYDAPMNEDDNTGIDAVMLPPSDPTILGRTNYFGCGGLSARGTSRNWS